MRKKNVSCTQEVLREWVLQLFFKTERKTSHPAQIRRQEGALLAPLLTLQRAVHPRPFLQHVPQSGWPRCSHRRLPALFIAHSENSLLLLSLFLFSFPPFFKLFFQLHLLYLFIFNCQLYHFLYLFIFNRLMIALQYWFVFCHIST